MHIFYDLLLTILATIWDVLPIAAIIFGFQLFVLRKAMPNLKKILMGFLFVLLGLAFFLEGLEAALFPLGKLMATQLTDLDFILQGEPKSSLNWMHYKWVYLFAFAIGFATTIAEQIGRASCRERV